MMFSELNASTYKYSSVYYYAEFESILSKIIACYLLMLKEKVDVYNDENKIRDVIVNNYPQIRNPTKVSERCGPNRQECDFSSLD